MGFNHGQKLAASFGTREHNIPSSRGRNLSDAIRGNFGRIDPSEVDHLTTDSERCNWACDQMAEYLQAEIEHLHAHRATMDHVRIALDRAAAGERAQFDGGKGATLARKYEVAATRELYLALHEYRVVEASGEPTGSAAFETPAPVAAAIETGDHVVLDQVGTIPNPRKPIREKDLEVALGSFGPTAPRRARPLGRYVDAPRSVRPKAVNMDPRP